MNYDGSSLQVGRDPINHQAHLHHPVSFTPHAESLASDARCHHDLSHPIRASHRFIIVLDNDSLFQLTFGHVMFFASSQHLRQRGAARYAVEWPVVCVTMSTSTPLSDGYRGVEMWIVTPTSATNPKPPSGLEHTEIP